MKVQRSVRWRAAAAAAVVVAVAGCGSSSSKSSGTTASTNAATGSTAAPTTAASGAGTTTPVASSATTTGAGGTATISGPGVTATDIKIGQIATISGPVPGIFQKGADALDAYVAYINSLGGVDGHKLTVIHKDDAYSCTNYTNLLRSLSTQVFAMVGTWSVEDGCGASVLKANPNFPNIEGYILNPTLYALPNATSTESQPPGYITTGYQWVKGKYPKDITQTAAIYPSSASFSFTTESSAAKSVGYKYVYSRGFGNTETNFTSDVLRMKADGVKIVDMGADGLQNVTDFLQDAAQQGFHPDAVICPSAYDPNFFKLMGNAPKSATDDVIAPLLFPMYLGTDRGTNPELNTYLTWLDKIHPGEQSDLFGLSSWAAGVQFVQAIHAAGSNVTQQGVVQALTNMGVFTANGLLPGSDPGHRKGANCMVIAGAQNGQWVRIDPPDKGFECNGTYHYISMSAVGG